MRNIPALPLGPAPTPAAPTVPEGAGPVLEALAAGRRTVTELAAWLGVHPNTVRTRLRGLLEGALVERVGVPSGSRGRPVHAYRLTAAGRAARAGRAASAGGAGDGRAAAEYRGLTAAFAAHLARSSGDPEQEAREIGRDWGRLLAGSPRAAEDPAPSGGNGTGGAADRPARARVLDLLEELGFGPEDDGHGIALRTCPLLELATSMPQVICRVHEGLVEGALDAYGASPTGVELAPFAEPGACRLRLV